MELRSQPDKSSVGSFSQNDSSKDTDIDSDNDNDIYISDKKSNWRKIIHIYSDVIVYGLT